MNVDGGIASIYTQTISNRSGVLIIYKQLYYSHKECNGRISIERL